MVDTPVDFSRQGTSATGGVSGFRFLGWLAIPIVVAAILLVLINILVFRTLNYYHWVKPDSVMGMVVQTEGLVEHQIVPGKRNIIVIGDSRVSEGFSAVIANEESKRPDLNFIQAGMPGTEPRVWYYFLRKIDPKQQKFAGIVLMASHFDDSHQPYDPAERIDDLTYLQPLTTFKDSVAVAETFHGFDERVHAFTAMMLPLNTARLDIQDFLAHKVKRVDQAKEWHAHFYQWSLQYPGQQGAVPALGKSDLASFDFKSAGLPPLKVNAMNEYVKGLLGQSRLISADQFGLYRQKWFGAIADEYQHAGVPVFVFQAPRGPYEAYGTASAADTGKGVLRQLAQQGRITLLDPKPLEQLEEPGYFFDSLHVNDKGRHIMSPAIARLVSQQLPAAR
ncbi:hypothetical protein [Caballeronia sp. LZ035]|uniref:hypothetical protein n=1 Tax=Caballeronia sp. LZ035 TaxID=3038568 RepID=UPI0028647B2D|nr:hypothetical protein [Caballeronia sp. LZ035]MDR5757956.1 hypothetical protein [Caballeronia sp. LZ035]